MSNPMLPLSREEIHDRIAHLKTLIRHAPDNDPESLTDAQAAAIARARTERGRR